MRKSMSTGQSDYMYITVFCGDVKLKIVVMRQWGAGRMFVERDERLEMREKRSRALFDEIVRVYVFLSPLWSLILPLTSPYQHLSYRDLSEGVSSPVSRSKEG